MVPVNGGAVRKVADLPFERSGASPWPRTAAGYRDRLFVAVRCIDHRQLDGSREPRIPKES